MFPQGFGKRTKAKAIFYLKENVVPVFKPKRSVPFAVVELINKELNRLASQGVISSTYNSEWETPPLCVNKKNNNIRVCTDFFQD